MPNDDVNNQVDSVSRNEESVTRKLLADRRFYRRLAKVDPNPLKAGSCMIECRIAFSGSPQAFSKNKEEGLANETLYC